MKVFNLARQMGKTYRIIKAMEKDPNALMITFSEISKDNIININPKLKGRVVSIHQYQLPEFNKRDWSEVHLDDLDMLLGIHNKIGIITMTNFPTEGEFS